MAICYDYLDSLKGSSKGLIGEILFKDSKKNIFCTKLISSNVLNKLPFTVPEKFLDFLTSHWYSLDCIEFKTKRLSDNRLIFVGVVLYEVKTQKFNPSQKALFKKCTFTKNELSIYQSAKLLGIDLKLVKVLFFENWKYGISVLDLDCEKYAYVICNGSRSFQKQV